MHFSNAHTILKVFSAQSSMDRFQATSAAFNASNVELSFLENRLAHHISDIACPDECLLGYCAYSYIRSPIAISLVLLSTITLHNTMVTWSAIPNVQISGQQTTSGDVTRSLTNDARAIECSPPAKQHCSREVHAMAQMKEPKVFALQVIVRQNQVEEVIGEKRAALVRLQLPLRSARAANRRRRLLRHSLADGAGGARLLIFAYHSIFPLDFPSGFAPIPPLFPCTFLAQLHNARSRNCFQKHVDTYPKQHDPHPLQQYFLVRVSRRSSRVEVEKDR